LNDSFLEHLITCHGSFGVCDYSFFFLGTPPGPISFSLTPTMCETSSQGNNNSSSFVVFIFLFEVYVLASIDFSHLCPRHRPTLTDPFYSTRNFHPRRDPFSRSGGHANKRVEQVFLIGPLFLDLLKKECIVPLWLVTFQRAAILPFFHG